MAVWSSAWVTRLIHSLNQYLLNTYYAPGMIPGIWETLGIKNPCSPEVFTLRKRFKAASTTLCDYPFINLSRLYNNAMRQCKY